MADSRAHVPCTSCVRASHRAPPLHLYMVCKSRMQTCTCAACASASSSAQNAIDAGAGARYSHALLTECAGIARVRGHRAVAPTHQLAAQTLVCARLFCRANGRQRHPAAGGPGTFPSRFWHAPIYPQYRRLASMYVARIHVVSLEAPLVHTLSALEDHNCGH